MKINWDKWFKPLLCIAALIYIMTIIIPLIVCIGFLAGLVAFGGVEIVSNDNNMENPCTVDCSKWNTTMHIGNDFDPNCSINDTGFGPTVSINITPDIIENVVWEGTYNDMKQIDFYLAGDGTVIDFSELREYIDPSDNKTYKIVIKNNWYWNDEDE